MLLVLNNRALFASFDDETLLSKNINLQVKTLLQQNLWQAILLFITQKR